MDNNEVSEERIAYHEAGHAVMLILYPIPTTLPFDYVTIDPSGPGPRVEDQPHSVPPHDTDDGRDFSRKEIVRKMAGVAAELRHAKQHPDEFWIFEDDATGIDKMLARLFPDATRRTEARAPIISALWRKTQSLVEKNWPYIDRLAQSLLAKKRLDYSEVAELLGLSSRRKV